MNEAQLRLATVLSVVLLGLSALLYFWEPEEAPTDAKATADVWKLEADDVTRVQLHNEKGDVELAKDGDEWRIEKPLEVAADDYKVRDLLDALEGAKKGAPVDGSDRSQYGLGESPVAKIVVTTKDGKTSELDVGSEAIGGRTYVSAAGGAVAAVRGDLHAKVTQDADAFRDRHVVKFEVAKVTEATLASPEGVLHVTRDGKEFWLEGYTRADERKVEDTLYGLLDLRFDRFVPDASVASPRYRVEVTEEGGTSHWILVGDDTPDGTLVSVQGGPAGYVRAESLKLLGQGPTDLGSAHAFPVDRDALTKADVTLGDAHFTLEKKDDQWTKDGAAFAKGGDVVDAIDAAKITYRREPVPAVTEVWGTVSLQQGDGDPRVVEIGQREGERWRVARDRKGGGPYLVPVSDLDAIPAALLEHAVPLP